MKLVLKTKAHKHRFVLTNKRIPDKRLVWRKVVKCKKCGFEKMQPLDDYALSSLKGLASSYGSLLRRLVSTSHPKLIFKVVNAHSHHKLIFKKVKETK